MWKIIRSEKRFQAIKEIGVSHFEKMEVSSPWHERWVVVCSVENEEVNRSFGCPERMRGKVYVTRPFFSNPHRN